MISSPRNSVRKLSEDSIRQKPYSDDRNSG